MGTASKLQRDRKHPQTHTGPVSPLALSQALWDRLHGNRHARRRAAVILRRNERNQKHEQHDEYSVSYAD